MSRIRKRFERLLNNPEGCTWSELKSIAIHYGLFIRHGAGSHHIVQYKKSKIAVPVHSNKVKTIYVKKVLGLILQVNEEE